MAVFMDTGGGDIYAAETKDKCLAAMKEDVGEVEFQRLIDENSIEDVSGTTKMRSENEDGSNGDLVTLYAEYESIGLTDKGFCIASENC